MMKTKLFAITAVFVSISAYSQEIKIKKGELFLDEKVVAKVEDKKNVYSFSDLSGQSKFSVKIFPTIGAEKGWVEFTGQNGNVKEMEFADSGFTLSLSKTIVKNALAQGLLTKDGINEEKVNDFFQATDRSVTLGRENGKKLEKQTNDNEDAIAIEEGVKIDNSGKIWNKNKELLGYIQRINTGNTTIILNYEYLIYDVNKIQIAKLSCTNSDSYNAKTGLKIKTYDQKEAEVSVTNNNFQGSMTEDKLADRIVKKLFANGYHLGDMKAIVESFANQKNQTAENNAKANSKNIYNTPGYVIDNTGVKKEGNITIEFESVDAKLGREKGVGDLTNYGGAVTLNVDGKNEFFKAKDGVKFCAGERCFLGTQGTEDSGTGNSSGSQLSILGESQFFEIQAENNGSYVLNHIKNPQYYYLKLNDQPKAAYMGDKAGFGKRKPEKIKKIFDEYVSCPALDFSKYDTKTKDGLINVLNDYQSSCKK